MSVNHCSGMRFASTRINLRVTNEVRGQEVLKFFAPHFSFLDEPSDAPDATLEFVEASRIDSQAGVSGQEVWVRKSHSDYFSIPALRYPTSSGELIVCRGTGTCVEYDTKARVIRFGITPTTRDIEVIEVVRDFVLKNEERHGTLVLHATIAARPDATVVVVGQKGAGKSTIALELVTHGGYELVSGDKALIRVCENARLAVHGWPDWPNMGLGTIGKYPRLGEDLGLTERIASATPEALWSIDNKVAIPPGVFSKHFPACKSATAVVPTRVLYPRISASAKLALRNVRQHYQLASPHLETAFHDLSNWNEFVEADSRGLNRARALERLPELWNAVEAFTLEGIGDLRELPELLS